MIRNSLPKSLIDNPSLAQWIGFEPDRRVRLATGKVELGQGILTALVQIAAEELDIDPARLRTISGDTAASPIEGFTSGSNSVDVAGASIRLVCAETRALFLSEAAERLGCRAHEFVVKDGRFLLEGADSGHDYWSLAPDVDLTRAATGKAPVKKPETYKLVGRSLPRTDLVRKIEGGAFIHDFAPAGLNHARILHRPRREARLVRLDEAAILRLAGGPTEIIRDGDFVAFVSESETAVMRAQEAARTKADWEDGLMVPDEVDHEGWLRAQPARDHVVETGEPLNTAGMIRVAHSYSRPYLTHGSIGPSCAVALFRDGRLDVWTHSQGVFTLRDWLARTLHIEAGNIHVHHREGAGCYGHNSADDAAFDAAFVAMRRPSQPIKVVWAREDEFRIAPISPAASVEIRAALDDRFRPVDWTIEIWSPTHARRPGMNGAANLLGVEALSQPSPSAAAAAIKDIPEEIGGGATRNAHALYDLPCHRIVHHLLPEVPVRTSTMRALGSYLNVFAIESFIDELAEIAGADPVAYRLSLQSDPRARRVIELAAEMSGWHGPPPAANISSDAVVGRGIGFGRYKNKAAYVAVVAEVEVDEKVRLRHLWAATDAGLVINPDGAVSQIEGGMIQAASWTLKERLAFEGGRPAPACWDDYPIIRFSEVPEIDVRLVGAPHEPALGIGEAAQGPTAGAIGNAVANALGTRIRALPLDRERIIAALLA